jgi:activator of Hsp90 ATPase-like protein
MSNASYTTHFTVDQTPDLVFAAINDVRRWWSEGIEGNANAVGAEFVHHVADIHRCKLKVLELIPGKKVVWLVLENHFSFTQDKTEWQGTTIVFEIAKKGTQTELRFTHEGLVPEYECYEACSEGWSTHVGRRLRDLITTSTERSNIGQPLTNAERALLE